MADDIDARLRAVEIQTAMLPEIYRQLEALRKTLDLHYQQVKERDEQMMALIQRLTALELEHTHCQRLQNATAGWLTERVGGIADWIVKGMALAGIYFAVKEGFFK